MKIRGKLFSGFFVVVAIGIFLGALGLYSDLRLVSLSEDILYFADIRTSISSILNSHYIWRHGLSETVYSGAAFTGSLNFNTCSLGQWLSGDESKELTDTEVISMIDQIIEPHQFIHNKAGEIIGHLENGEQDEAEKIFREEVLPKTLEVISGLEVMQNRYSVLLDGKISEVYNTGLMFQSVIMVFIIIALITCILLAVIITSIITKPVVQIAKTIKKVAEGDLTSSMQIKTKDEIGDLVRDFNYTVDKIKTLVLGIKSEADTLSQIGSTLASDMNETAAAVNEITANVKSIENQVMNQSASVTETDATMEQIAENIDKLKNHVEKQTGSVEQSSSAIEQMLANIQSVTKTLVVNSENVDELIEASEVGRTGLQNVFSDIQEIAKESEGLLEINKVMESISSQTDLLSMNAAIEAAHAGDSGKGFAVVAGEIRKLAESSGEQSKTISTVLKKIKSSIDKISASTNIVLKKFEAIDTGVKTVADQEGNIRNAMEEQNHGSRQILEAIGILNENTQLVKNEVDEMLEGAREVIKEANNLKKTTEEISGGMSEMASGADQINSAVNNINDLSNKNRESTSHLITEVSRFKVV